MRSPSFTIPAGAGPIAALVLASLLWGTADVAGKLALIAVPPAMLAALRFGVALAIFWPLARWRGGPPAPMRITAPLGLLGVALTFFLQNQGLARTSATNASLLQAAPALTLLLAAVVLGERLGPRRVAAVAATTAGVVLVTLASGSGLSEHYHEIGKRGPRRAGALQAFHSRWQAPCYPLPYGNFYCKRTARPRDLRSL